MYFRPAAATSSHHDAIDGLSELDWLGDAARLALTPIAKRSDINTYDFFLRRCTELLLYRIDSNSFRWAFGSRESVYASLHDRQQPQSRSPDVILERQIARYTPRDPTH